MISKTQKKYFVTGIDTNIGKTLISAILVNSGKTDYWKPVQSGLEEIDGDFIKNNSFFEGVKIHPESYKLKEPASPHLAAKLENKNIELKNIHEPKTNNHLIVEGAGGIIVPLNEQHTILDLIKKLDYEVIIVSKNYLGSINHTLMTINILKANSTKIKGVIFSGHENLETECIINKLGGIKQLPSIPFIKEVSKETILEHTKKYDFLWK